MKKIVIVTKDFGIGGCEKALISMLSIFPKNKYEITLLVMKERGELLTEIPSWVTVKTIPSMNQNSVEIIKSYVKKLRFLKATKSIISLIKLRQKGYYSQYYYHSKALLQNKEAFDLAISYFAPCEYPDWYTAFNIKAKKKIVWVHSDVSEFNGINSRLTNKMYSKFDKIFCVSHVSAEKFKMVFPLQANKVEIFYNIISKNTIRALGESKINLDTGFSGLKILTVGRLSKEKGQDLIPYVANNLKKRGYKFKWYCIGEGPLREELEREIKEYGLQNDVLLLGLKKNPYPYYKQCDIYVQPSRFEAYCTTVNEARCFNKPIIATDVAGTREQLINGHTGMIINFNLEELYSNIVELINNKQLKDLLKLNLQRLNIDTHSEFEKIIDLLE
ncbi:glycosyltransferase [Rossellomorea vietnamensis]|uniref:glycosyltransferase n=1 Tax=Rossellomorea vietnamensis TaxID=218284 RepID=UPI003D2C0967